MSGTGRLADSYVICFPGLRAGSQATSFFDHVGLSVCRESEKTKLLISQQTQKVVEKEAETERIKAVIGKKCTVTV